MTNQSNSSGHSFNKKIYLSERNKKLFGVCGGIGEYFDIDPSVIRLAWIIFTVLSGLLPGILAYILAAIVLPGNSYNERSE